MRSSVGELAGKSRGPARSILTRAANVHPCADNGNKRNELREERDTEQNSMKALKSPSLAASNTQGATLSFPPNSFGGKWKGNMATLVKQVPGTNRKS